MTDKTSPAASAAPAVAERGKRPVSRAMTGPYGHPFHPILVTIPIGAWVSSLVFDIASYIVDDPEFLARGAAWLIAVGVIGALAAASVGFLDLLGIPTGARAFTTALQHMSLMLVVTSAFAGNFFWRIIGDLDSSAAVGPLVLTIVSLIVLVVGGALGGKLAYRYGVRVVDEATQADGFER